MIHGKMFYQALCLKLLQKIDLCIRIYERSYYL
nr:MAG TPA: hypothetical protein [Caudoviricetes sp.]DAT65095.1 MAG TPA: hypothetical protein [Caudoviricetes sp.]DAY39794.1 MAG TPA: hypothetical protein [Caudoviricetes sp.]